MFDHDEQAIAGAPTIEQLEQCVDQLEAGNAKPCKPQITAAEMRVPMSTQTRVSPTAQATVDHYIEAYANGRMTVEERENLRIVAAENNMTEAQLVVHLCTTPSSGEKLKPISAAPTATATTPAAFDPGAAPAEPLTPQVAKATAQTEWNAMSAIDRAKLGMSGEDAYVGYRAAVLSGHFRTHGFGGTQNVGTFEQWKQSQDATK